LINIEIDRHRKDGDHWRKLYEELQIDFDRLKHEKTIDSAKDKIEDARYEKEIKDLKDELRDSKKELIIIHERYEILEREHTELKGRFFIIKEKNDNFEDREKDYEREIKELKIRIFKLE
jgi:predicted  nucleic acid-binding Zn-ribbon protein